MASDPDRALKHIFDLACFERTADALRHAAPACDADAFLSQARDGLEPLSLMQRMRHMADCLHGVLPAGDTEALDVLRAMGPRMTPAFATLALCDYIARYRLHAFDASMQTLRDLTALGTAEYGVRPFLRADPDRALAHMMRWAGDPDPHVRRLASEGSRPRLPWSFHLETLATDPDRVGPLLDALKQDDSLYVRKSVANHLNDITKRHPEWVLARLARWPLDDARCAWIARHALRTLIKRGDARALALIGVARDAAVRLVAFDVAPATLRLGERVNVTATLESTGTHAQKLEVDYAIEYVKRDGTRRLKVFKLRAFTLAPGARVMLARTQVVRDFTTRRHYAGRHPVHLIVNGTTLCQAFFDLEI